jgi:hypothetical protein
MPTNTQPFHIAGIKPALSLNSLFIVRMNHVMKEIDVPARHRIQTEPDKQNYRQDYA